MESDGSIVEKLPEIVMDGAKEVTGTLEYFLSIFTLYIRDSLALVFGLAVTGYIAFRIGKYIYVTKKVSRLHKENKETLAFSASSIKRELEKEDQKLLSEVANLSWEDLVERLHSGSLTALIALRAYQAAALEVQSRTNAVVSWIEEAAEQAKHLDSLPSDQRGPLHGVPVSIKECYDVKNEYSTAGLATLARKEVTEDCPIVKVIKNLGGIPFCKTNVPQVMYSLQCSNPIYGTTMNPQKEGREAGGSSGGEGALVAGLGSILGLGSDVGGSLRNPPAFCGGYSLKPTEGRHLSQLGVAPYWGGFSGINVVGGWITNSSTALEAAWRAVWTTSSHLETHDTNLVPMAWDENSYQTKPRIGYFTSDDFLEPAPGCKRAVEEAVTHLESLGYTLVPFKSPDINQVLYFFNGIVLHDKNSTMYKEMSWDLYDSTLNGVVAAVTLYKLPSCLKKYLINPIISQITRVKGVENIFYKTMDLVKGLEQRDSFKRHYLEQMRMADVDLILCPGQMLPAPPTGTLGTFVAPVTPYIPWNVLNFPAAVAPVTTWNEKDTDALSTYPTDDMAYKMIHSYCDGAEGLPLAVQVVGKPFKDEQVLRVISELGAVKPKL